MVYTHASLKSGIMETVACKQQSDDQSVYTTDGVTYTMPVLYGHNGATQTPKIYAFNTLEILYTQFSVWCVHWLHSPSLQVTHKITAHTLPHKNITVLGVSSIVCPFIWLACIQTSYHSMCVHARLHVCVCKCVCVYVCSCMHSCACVYVCACMVICVCMCFHIHVCVCMLCACVYWGT